MQISLKEKALRVSTVQTLSLQAHLNQTTAAANVCLASLRLAITNLNKDALTTLYKSCVKPILEHRAPI